MHFEHLIQINDTELFGVDTLSRAQVWLGLQARAHRPGKFILGLESADILNTEQTAEGNLRLQRRLDFGSFQILDEIELFDNQRTENRIHPSPVSGASSMVIQIEEPEAGQLWLRFTYEVEDPAGLSQAEQEELQQYNEARKQAYKAADIDTVKIIRELALMAPDLGDEPMTSH